MWGGGLRLEAVRRQGSVDDDQGQGTDVDRDRVGDQGPEIAMDGRGDGPGAPVATDAVESRPGERA